MAKRNNIPKKATHRKQSHLANLQQLENGDWDATCSCGWKKIGCTGLLVARDALIVHSFENTEE
jgi:hypothetical protein